MRANAASTCVASVAGLLPAAIRPAVKHASPISAASTAVAGPLPLAGALFAPAVTVVNLMTLDGSRESQRPYRGREAAVGYFRQVQELMPERELRDLRVTTAGDTVLVQFNGDFRTADGRPYRNVHVFRFDWRDGLLVSLEACRRR
jgi:ketosteroid isomerase-like protein